MGKEQDGGEDFEDPRDIEYKVFYETGIEIDEKAANGNGTLKGYAAVFGNKDRVGDIIVPGFFKDILPDFSRDGVVMVRHGKESSEPIATITEVKEDGRGLSFTAEYHSTEYAQQQRIVAQERLTRGKSVPNSIGYLPRSQHDGGYEYKDGTRYLKKCALLAEISTNVWIPANPLALTQSVKDGAPRGGLTLTDELELVLAANKSLVERWGDWLNLKEGRAISGARMEQLQNMHGSLRDAHGAMGGIIEQMQGLMDSAMPKQEMDMTAQARKAFAEYLKLTTL